MPKESEETEVKKDIEWLKEEIWRQDTIMEKGYIYTHDLMSIINEVDDIEEPRQEEHDPVHNPSHYMQGHIETIDKIKLLLTPEEYLGYLKGNVIKYDRAPFKGNVEQDYDKQKVYYDWALEQEADQWP